MQSQRMIRLWVVLIFSLSVDAGTAFGDINEDLLVAARKGDVEAVKVLLNKGADVNAKSPYGATSLSFASDRGHNEVVKLLLAHGADVNVKDTFYGETPLGWAAYRGNAEIIRLLLDGGAEAKDAALTTGVEENKPEVVKVLLERGGLKSETLSSALAMAVKDNRDEIIELLRKAGAVPPPKADFQVDPETLKSYVGVYKSQEEELVISLREGKLMGSYSGEDPLTLGAIDKVTFKPIEFEGITVTFTLEGGNVIGLLLNEGGKSEVFKRVGEK